MDGTEPPEANQPVLAGAVLLPGIDDSVAHAAGIFASICFFIQYVPQMLLNWQRRSTVGFSATGIVLKLLGACFLLVNAVLTGENFSVALYGLANVLQHSVFMFQFWLYADNDAKVASSSGKAAGDEDKAAKGHIGHHPHRTLRPWLAPWLPRLGPERYLLWLGFPVVPYVIAVLVPASIPFTNSIKPLTQVMSHLPQLRVCYQLRTTSGVSMTSQHLNMLGGLAGLFMCLILPPRALSTYLIYANSCAQALSMYVLWAIYDKPKLPRQLSSPGTRRTQRDA